MKRSGQPDHCVWCGQAMEHRDTGRRRRYCSHSCRQRSYESRKKASELQLPEDTVLLTQASADAIVERAFVSRCAAEDLYLAILEREDHETLVELAHELLVAARDCERLR